MDDGPLKYEPVLLPETHQPIFQDAVDNNTWRPFYSHPCLFGPDMFLEKMMNLIENPNLNSSWLFRADILDDEDYEDQEDAAAKDRRITSFEVRDFVCYRALVRRLVPRNEKRDASLNQTCSFYRSKPASGSESTLIIYAPHAESAAEIPYYHPNVRGIAHLHQWDPASLRGSVSIHFLAYLEVPLRDTRLERTAYRLLETIHKHGHNEGYVRRVNHDALVPRRRFQDRYALLKSKYARQLVESWVENTDPTKHVFEDLGIAAFLIELWREMYPDNFPGFVDIGCGNGLLVHVLAREGYHGWGFDARRRKSWALYEEVLPDGCSLEERILLPKELASAEELRADIIYDGVFPKGTFIISNHADELTPWTPILAAASHCPFIMIPCCSHNLAGQRFRAPPPRDKTKSVSAYSSLVDWVSRIAEDCGWEVETEMLRIPSTRNTCLVGRRRKKVGNAACVSTIIEKYGGAEGYYEAVAKLTKSTRSH